MQKSHFHCIPLPKGIHSYTSPKSILKLSTVLERRYSPILWQKKCLDK